MKFNEYILKAVSLRLSYFEEIAAVGFFRTWYYTTEDVSL